MNFYSDKALEVSKNREVLATVYSDWIKFEGGSPAGGMAFDTRVTVPFAGTGSLVLSLQESDDGVTPSTVVSTPSLAAAALGASGAQNPPISLTIPKTHKNYLRVGYTVTGSFTAGKLSTILNTEV